MKVAIGPLFDEFGGVSQHILGIKRFSCHDVILVPSPAVRWAISKTAGLARYGYQKLMTRTRLNGYDVLHSHVDPWFTSRCLLSRTSTCKWVHTYHTLYFEEDYRSGLRSWQETVNSALLRTAARADVRISISQWLHDYLLEAHSIQTEILPNGVDLESCDNADPGRFRRKHGFSDPFILFVGNIQEIKDPRLFVELARQIPEVRFVMIGRGLSERNLAKQYEVSVPPNLTLEDEMKRRDVLDAIAASDVYVMTSKREGIPTTLLEAMGMRKPVVAPAHSGCREVVHGAEYGFLYEPGSLDDLVEQTRQALISEHVGERARERVAQIYDWKVLARRIDAVYDSCR